MIGWCERWNSGDGAPAAFIERAKGLQRAGFDVSVVVAPDYSHLVMVVCDRDAVTASSPQVAWIEPDGQLPLEAA